MSIPSANATVVNCENHAEFPGGAGLPAETNLTQIKGVAVSTNAGAADAATLRTVEANDSPVVTGGALILAQSTATAASAASLDGKATTTNAILANTNTYLSQIWALLALVWALVTTGVAHLASIITGQSNTTSPDPGASQTITPVTALVPPVSAEMVALDLDTQDVVVSGSVVANAGTACRLRVYGEGRTMD
jgi:hypothetical protein